MAVVLNNLGTTVRYQGDLTRAAALHEESLALRRELGDTWGMANALHNLGQVAYGQGELARALRLAEEDLAVRRELGDKHGMALSLALLGAVAQARGDAAQAVARYTEGLALSRALNDRVLLATCLEGLAAVAATHGQVARAGRLTEAAATLRGAVLPPAGEATYRDDVAALVAILRGEEAPSPQPEQDAAASWDAAGRLSGGQQLQIALLQDE